MAEDPKPSHRGFFSLKNPSHTPENYSFVSYSLLKNCGFSNPSPLKCALPLLGVGNDVFQLKNLQPRHSQYLLIKINYGNQSISIIINIWLCLTRTGNYQIHKII